MAKKMTPKIRINHDWVGLGLGKRNISASYGGVKCGSGVPTNVMDLWEDTIHFGKKDALAKIGLKKADKPNMETVLKAFAANIDTIWPDWAKEDPMPKVGDTVTAFFGKRRGHDTAVVLSTTKKYITCDWPKQGKIGVHFDMITKIVPAMA